MTVPVKNLPLLMNLSYYAYNRGLPHPDGSRGDFQPVISKDGQIEVTYCNQAMQYILSGFGYDRMNGMNANEMTGFMGAPENGWIAVGDDVAQAHASNGILVLAGWINTEGHGHICMILPGILEKSGTAGKAVPKCVNIGREVFIGKRLSFAFDYSRNAPTLYALAGMI